MKRLTLIVAFLLLTTLACEGTTPPTSFSPTPVLDRLAAIPADAIKITPETDVYPVKSETDEYADPVPLPFPINTSGAEDSAFVMPDGKTLYVWFTPSPAIPVEQQLLDGVTGIYTFQKTETGWTAPQRVWLQDPGKVSLDGCEFVLGNTMWFCSVREGYTGIHWFTAEFVNGKWQNWKNADFDPAYEVGELHITADGEELYFHSSRPGGLGAYDLWVSQNVNGVWQEPINLTMLNSIYNDGWPFVTQDGLELWFTRVAGAPELWRSKRVNGVWTQPQKMFAPFAGEASLDTAGNVYFTHHFYKDNLMLEADIYVAVKK